MFMAAVMVSVGYTVPAALGARLKRVPHGELSPAVPPLELMHCSRMSASVLISAVGSVAPVGSVGPGVVPLVVVTISLIAANASASPAVFVELVPMWLALVINGASAQTVATVVSSFTLIKLLR